MNRSEAEQSVRKCVQNVYVGNQTALTRILGWHKFFVDTTDVGFGGHILLDGYWEMWLTLFCARNVRRGMVAVDVGANMGYYTVLFASNVGPEGQILAVEPNPHAVTLLKRSVDINGYSGRTRIEAVACSDGSSDSARLVVPTTESKNAYISLNRLSADPGSIDTACVALDKLCESFDRVDFIKIDAEGSEERIFAGMSRVLERHRPMVVVEINVARYSNPTLFLTELRSVYGQIRYVSYDGYAVFTTVEEILSKNVGQDWLLVICPYDPV